MEREKILAVYVVRIRSQGLSPSLPELELANQERNRTEGKCQRLGVVRSMARLTGLSFTEISDTERREADCKVTIQNLRKMANWLQWPFEAEISEVLVPSAWFILPNHLEVEVLEVSSPRTLRSRFYMKENTKLI